MSTAPDVGTASAATRVEEPDEPGPAALAARVLGRPALWREALTIVVFYELYSLARNLQGSHSISPAVAFRNARAVIRWEEALGLYHEEAVQRVALNARVLVRAMNVYYGTAHFVVTIGVLLWLFLRAPERYRRWRWTLGATTGLALIGFVTFPLLPPRLLPVEHRAEALVATAPAMTREAATEAATEEVNSGAYKSVVYDYEDTLLTVGGLWSFESGPIAKLSNQYAAMPSLHFGWSAWCTLALLPAMRRWWSKALAVAHPTLTLIAIVATANHYILDAVGGAVVLAFGALIGTVVTRRDRRPVTEVA